MTTYRHDRRPTSTITGPLSRKALQLACASRSRRRRQDIDLGRYLLILGQLGLLIALTYAFQLESEAFRRLLVLTAGGFAAHYFLPLRFRLWFFVAALARGHWPGARARRGRMADRASVSRSSASVTCRCPSSRGRRFSAPRRSAWRCSAIGVGQVPWSSALWPILGSMFVFRLIIYLYDRSHESAPPRLSQTLGYFFLLPNVCFPLFPVVDFKKFCRHYYDEERHETYQVGIEWIWRGLLQLVLYRVIYYHFTARSRRRG